MPSVIWVEVCYANPSQQWLLPIELPQGSLVSQAIESSGILNRCPELVLDDLKVGIFSKKCTLDTVLKEGDRVEIYRPLTIDPKVARRLRAQKNKN